MIEVDAVFSLVTSASATLPGMSTGNEFADFLNTKWGQYALIAVFFGLIIAFLRILFGPRGFFREKEWDEWNEEARRCKQESCKELRREYSATAAKESSSKEQS